MRFLIQKFHIQSLLQGMGFEPTRVLNHWILSPAPWTRLGHPCTFLKLKYFKRITTLQFMEKITHIFFAIFLFSIILIFFKLNPIFLILIILGAIFPDFDIYFLHRKLLHNIWIISFFSFLFLYFGKMFSIFFFIGSISHLFLDSMTPMGIYPFWPINYKIRIKTRIKTGNIYELIFFFFILVSSIIIFSIVYRLNVKITTILIFLTLTYIAIKRKLPYKF